MKVLFVSLLFVLSLAGCKDKEELEKVPAPAAEKPKSDYFPILDFLRSEASVVDSLPGGIKKITTMNGKTDSNYIEHGEFRQYANEFLDDGLEKSAMEANFEEQSFFDNTLNAATFIYSSRKPDHPIQRVHVLSRPDAAYDKVISIYIEKIVQKQDSVILQKMTWKPGRELQVNKETQVAGAEPRISQTRIVWDNWEADQ